MKLSERMARAACQDETWVTDAVSVLEAELDAAHVRNQELTARADRLRVERDAAHEATRMQVDWYLHGVVVMHLVYEMREHAIDRCGARCVIDNLFDDERHEHETCRKFFDATVERDAATDARRRLNRRAQSAESRATKLAREVATLRVRLQGAIAKIPPMDLRRELDPIKSRCSTCDIGATYGTRGRQGCPECDGTGRPIPPAALEASDVASRCPFCRGTRCVPGVLPDQPDRCVACAPDVPPSSGGARGLDAADDLARRRVTERVEDERPCETCGTLACETRGSHQCALLHVARLREVIAERDARIEALEREREELQCEHDAHNAAATQCEKDIAELRERVAFQQARAILAEAALHAERMRVVCLVERAEDAEAVIAKVRKVIEHRYDNALTAWDTCKRVHAILDGKEGA